MEPVSIVTTTLNEREFIAPFVERVRRALRGWEHEILVVDDHSPDGTFEEALRHADRALLSERKGQTAGLLQGIKAAKYPVVVTLDVDLENPPELIPQLVEAFLGGQLDLLVASRRRLPRVAERAASLMLRRALGVRDIFSNFRVYRREAFLEAELRLGETFGGELLLYARKKGLKIGEIFYDPPPRRSKPRIGGRLRANARCLLAAVKLLAAAAPRGP